jgi:hypothetical protein
MSLPVAVLALALAPLVPPQESRAVFDAPLVELNSLNRIEHLIEFDGTPGYEALSWWWQDETKSGIDVRAWDIDPTQGFSLLWEFGLTNPGGTSTSYMHLVPVNLNGGGTDDLIVINYQTIRVHLRKGHGAPELVQTLLAADDVLIAFATDPDADGDDDLIVIDRTGSVQLFENGGAAAGWAYTAAGPPLYLGAGVWNHARLGELTGDEIPDLLYVRTDAIVIQPIAADLTFPPETAFPLTASLLNAHPIVGDIDSDGDEDGIIFYRGPNPSYTPFYIVLRRDGPSAFSQEALAMGGPATDLVDLDGDGDLDGACCGGGGGGPPPPKPSLRAWENRHGSTFELCHNDGSGAFTVASELRGLGAARLAGAVDVDFDGDVDLVAGRVVYYAPGPIETGFEAVINSNELGHGLLTDCDADGDPDVAFAMDEVGRSDGTLHVDSAIPTLAPPANGIVFKGPGYPGDFDGDGDLDLLVAKWKSGTFRRMRLLKNAGGGHLIDAGDASDPGVSFSKTGNAYLFPAYAWPIDWDADGDLDLFTWGWPGNSDTSYWANDGAGYFVEAVPVAGLQFYIPHGFADFNGDTITDLLAVAGDDARNVTVFLGDGNGGASYGPLFPSLIQPFGASGSIAIDDFDNDGDPDLVLSDQDDDFVGDFLLMQNDGLAGFNPIVLEPPGPTNGDTIGRAIVADVNADGWSDVIVSVLDTGLQSSAILLRNPDGVLFQPMFEQVIRPYDVGDIDGDGDVDLADGSIAKSYETADRLVANRLREGTDMGARIQVGSGVPGAAGVVPTLGATGPFRPGERLTLLLTGAAPGVTGRLVIRQAGTGTGSSSGGGMPSFGAVSHGAQVIPLTTSGTTSDPIASGLWSLHRRIQPAEAGRTLVLQVELDDPAAAGGEATSQLLYVHVGEELN